MKSDPSATEPMVTPSVRRPNPASIKFRRFSVFGVKLLSIVLTVYCAILLIGIIPVNNGFEEPVDGVEIFVSSNAVHADIVVPITHKMTDWKKTFPNQHFVYDVNDYSHVAIGWGDQGFFIDTPTWGDFKLSTATYALLWSSPTCIHVSLKREAFLSDDLRRVRISEVQYQQLVEYIRASIEFEDNRAIAIPGASYGKSDAFFEAKGNYHAFNTCNSWVGGGLKACGVRAPLLSPLPKSPFLYLPD